MVRKEIEGNVRKDIRHNQEVIQVQISRSEMPVNSSLEKIFANTIQPFKILI